MRVGLEGVEPLEKYITFLNVTKLSNTDQFLSHLRKLGGFHSIQHFEDYGRKGENIRRKGRAEKIYMHINTYLDIHK